MVLLDRPYCELVQKYEHDEKGTVGRIRNDLRRVYARADDFDTYFGVVLDDLLALVPHLTQQEKRGSEALPWSCEV